MLYATEIAIFTDVIEILWLKSCRQSSAYLTRLSLILSNFNVQIRHVKWNSQWLPDILSRCLSVKDLEQNHPSLTVAQANQLFQLVTCPDGYLVPMETLRKYFTLPGLKNPLTKQKTSTKTSKCVLSSNSYVPPKKSRKKFHFPSTSKYHPLYKEQSKQAKENMVNFSKPDSEMNLRVVGRFSADGVDPVFDAKGCSPGSNKLMDPVPIAR